MKVMDGCRFGLHAFVHDRNTRVVVDCQIQPTTHLCQLPLLRMVVREGPRADMTCARRHHLHARGVGGLGGE